MIMIPREGQWDEGSTTRFDPGELVCHRRYGYRGVVVASDLSCAAPEDWYRTNQTQPRRDQPWYHVLVDRALHTTYAAEENLMPDDSGEEITHQLLARFFDSFQNGHYVRNNRQWESPSA